jgi:beta-1,4-mannosyl-glycoprotein beta-1,4-N-acetylglucosaminyltransferase
MIIDAFLFYNELDMLKFRLIELDSVVDKFVIVEATKTFTGNKKPLYFKKNKNRFKKYLHKIHYVVLNDMPDGDTWTREAYQRTSIGNILKDLNLKDNDIIILSDVDEIPDINKLQEYKTNGLPKPKAKSIIAGLITLLQDTYYYNLENKVLAYSVYDKCKNAKYHNTIAAKIFYYSKFIELKLSTQELRKYHKRPTCRVRCGWHLTFFMSPVKIKEKMKNFSHDEYSGDIKKLIKDKKIKFEKIKIEDNKYLPNNYKLWL